MTVSFGDPAPVHRWEGNDWDEVVRTLKARPDEWGHIGVFSTGVASHIRAGRYKAFLPVELHDADKVEKRAYMRRTWDVTTRIVRESTEERTGSHLYIKFTP